jgi:hypothetical protein
MNEGWVVQFRIILPPVIRDQWYELADKLNNVQLNDSKDVLVCRWTGNKIFSVKFVYLHLTKEDIGPNFNILKSKIPEKIKIFMWLLAQKAILTKENMIKRKWQGDP